MAGHGTLHGRRGRARVGKARRGWARHITRQAWIGVARRGMARHITRQVRRGMVRHGKAHYTAGKARRAVAGLGKARQARIVRKMDRRYILITEICALIGWIGFMFCLFLLIKP